MQQKISLIPIDEISIINPRERNPAIAEGIRQNIKNIGLKRPITVTLNNLVKNSKKYCLICGQGRLEAYIAAGEKEIPAIIRSVSKEEAHIMSLVENIARRHSNGLELIQSIKYLKNNGYDDAEIALKTNLGKEYIRGVIRLLENGEDYLVNAVEKGRIPLYQALKITTEDDVSLQNSLAKAFESNNLSSKDLKVLQKIITRRKHYGKGLSTPQKKKYTATPEELIASLEQNAKQKKQILAKSSYIRHLLTYTTGALNHLLDDKHFVNQLRASGLDSIPQNIIMIINRKKND